MRRGRAGLATWAAVLAAGLAAPAALAKPKEVPLATPGDPPILIGPGRAQVEYSGPDASLPGPFAEFARYALQQAKPPADGTPVLSALIDQKSLAGSPRRSTCADKPPAVALDLDPADKPFDLDNPPLPATGLPQVLAILRSAGVTVMWVSSLPMAEAQRLYTVLRASELDPTGTDRLLLPRKADEHKQARLIASGRDWCVLAIAADRRSDFDEVYEYLRDPDGWVAQALQKNIGAGWFLAPLPIR